LRVHCQLFPPLLAIAPRLSKPLAYCVHSTNNKITFFFFFKSQADARHSHSLTLISQICVCFLERTIMAWLLWLTCVAITVHAQKLAVVPTAVNGIAGIAALQTGAAIFARQDNCPSSVQHSCRDIGHEGACCDNDQYCYVDADFVPRCCPLGSECLGNNPCQSGSFRCAETRTVGSTTTEIPRCCLRQCPTQDTFLCPDSVGCCSLGAVCGDRSCISEQDVASTLQTSSATASTSNGPIIEEEDGGSGELSDGAIAGVAAGTVVGVGFILGALFCWFCLRRRRRGATTRASQTASQVDGPAPTERAMTEVTAASGPRRRFGTNDYFGPNASVGPYTETEFSSPATSPGFAVPHQPQTPDHITAPVEMDSLSRIIEHDALSNTVASNYLSPISMDGRYELYGRDTSALSSPMEQRHEKELA
jgi:hypothetical protein